MGGRGVKKQLVLIERTLITIPPLGLRTTTTLCLLCFEKKSLISVVCKFGTSISNHIDLQNVLSHYHDQNIGNVKHAL